MTTHPIDHHPHPRAESDSNLHPHPKLVEDAHKHDKLAHTLLDNKTPVQSRVHNLVALHGDGVKALNLTDKSGHAHNLQIHTQESKGKISEIKLVEIHQKGSTKSEQVLLAAKSNDGIHFDVVSDLAFKNNYASNDTRQKHTAVEHEDAAVRAATQPTHHRASSSGSGETHVAATRSLPNLSISGSDLPIHSSGSSAPDGKAPLFSAMFNPNSGSSSDYIAPTPQAGYQVPNGNIDHTHPWSASRNSDGTLAFGFRGGFVDTDGAAADSQIDSHAQKQTSLAFSNGSYLNTYKDAYVVFPQSLMDRYGFHIGDAVWLCDDDTGKKTACLIGDIGPENSSRFGEASVKAWRELGYSDVTGNNGPGKDHHFRFIVAPNTGNRTADAIRSTGAVSAMLQKTNSDGSATA